MKPGISGYVCVRNAILGGVKLRQHPFNGFAGVDSSEQGWCRNADVFRPLCNILFEATKLNYSAPSVVVVLRDTVGPYAIRRAVVSIVIFPLNGESVLVGWFHVLPEVLELHPSLAYFNPTSSVIFVVRCFWIETPRFHASPNVVKSSLPSNRLTMCTAHCANNFLVEAAA